MNKLHCKKKKKNLNDYFLINSGKKLNEINKKNE